VLGKRLELPTATHARPTDDFGFSLFLSSLSRPLLVEDKPVGGEKGFSSAFGMKTDGTKKGEKLFQLKQFPLQH
jgi:hypothetical protein